MLHRPDQRSAVSFCARRGSIHENGDRFKPRISPPRGARTPACSVHTHVNAICLTLARRQLHQKSQSGVPFIDIAAVFESFQSQAGARVGALLQRMLFLSGDHSSLEKLDRRFSPATQLSVSCSPRTWRTSNPADADSAICAIANGVLELTE